MRISRCTIPLALGIGATVAAAWLPALIHPAPPKQDDPQQFLGPCTAELAEPPFWAWFATRHTSIAHTTMIFRKGNVTDETVARTNLPIDTPAADLRRSLPHWSPVPDRGMRVDVHSFGWPMASVRGTRSSPSGEHSFWVAYDAPAPGARDVEIPVQPIVRGLVINIAFWTLAIGATAYTMGATRRSWRRRHDRCPTCGYEKPNDPCPECGEFIDRPTR